MPTPGLPFPLHLCGGLRGRKSIPILTQTEGNKSPLISSCPSLPAWQQPRAHSLQLAACSGAQNPGVPALWEHRPKLGRVEMRCQGPHAASPTWGRTSLPTPPLSPPRNLALCLPWRVPLPLLGACLKLGSQGWYPIPSPDIAKVTPQANGIMKKGSKGRSKAAGDPPSCQMPQEDQLPCTVQPCSAVSSSCPQREPWLGSRTHRADLSSVAQWPRL